MIGNTRLILAVFRAAMAARRNQAWRIVLLLALVGLWPLPARAVPPPPPVIRQVLLDPADSTRQTVGALGFRGGVHIDWVAARFGGFSGLAISADGRELVAVSDKGGWLGARPLYRDGRLIGLADVRLGGLQGPGGESLRGKSGDAEGLAADGAGGYVVAFERSHNLLHFPAARPPFSVVPTPVAEPDGMRDLKKNRGIEALARLCTGDYLVVAESAGKGAAGSDNAWLGDRGVWREFAYARAAGFRAKDAVTLPDCSVLILESGRDIDKQPVLRMRRLPAAALTPGAAPTEPDEIAELAAPLTAERFEGLAARRMDDGSTAIYLISDDNFDHEQRTLLLMFVLQQPGG